MKYLFQFGVIMIFVCLGEILGAVIPLPIAGSIYGLILLFLCLVTGIVKLSWVDDVATWSHGIMGLFFVAPAVAIMNIWGDIAGVWYKLVLLLVITYLVSMITTGVTAQALIKNPNDNPTKKEKRAGNKK